jgi:DNA-binding FrmR family transcriptional regulator
MPNTLSLDGEQAAYTVKEDPLQAAINRLRVLTGQLAALTAEIERARQMPPPHLVELTQELAAATDYIKRARADLALYNIQGAQYCHKQASECIAAANGLLAEAGLWEGEPA